MLHILWNGIGTVEISWGLQAFVVAVAPEVSGQVKYESVNRAIIPINKNYYLLIAIDIGENDVDKIIMEKVIPTTRKRGGAG